MFKEILGGGVSVNSRHRNRKESHRVFKHVACDVTQKPTESDDILHTCVKHIMNRCSEFHFSK